MSAMSAMCSTNGTAVSGTDTLVMCASSVDYVSGHVTRLIRVVW